MTRVTISEKYCTVNPLKMSPSIGAALAFLGVDNSMPLLHGSQGCTSFGLVLFVRHFREAIPMQTTAMSEVATVLGGFDNLEQALVNIAELTTQSSMVSHSSMSPRLIFRGRFRMDGLRRLHA